MENTVTSFIIDKGIATIISAGVGALIAVFIANRSSKTQLDLLQIQLKSQQEQFEKEQEEKLNLIKLEYSNKFNNEKRMHIEKTYHLLSKLKSKCSTTSSFISTDIKDLDAFHKFYLEDIVNIINEVHMRIGLYFPDLKKDMDSIHKNANLFWGYQQQYIRQTNANTDNLSQVLSAVQSISNSVGNVQDKLKTEFDKLDT